MYHSLGLLIDDLAYPVVVLSCSLHLPSLAHIMNISKKKKKREEKRKERQYQGKISNSGEKVQNQPQHLYQVTASTEKSV